MKLKTSARYLRNAVQEDSMKIIKSVFCSISAFLMLTNLPAMSVKAARAWHQIGFMGDLNNNAVLEAADTEIMLSHLLGRDPLTNENSYYIENSFIGIHGADGRQYGDYFVTADMDENGRIDAADLTLQKRSLLKNDPKIVWRWYDSQIPQQTDPPEGFISPPIAPVTKFLPSQGRAKLLILYVDFPDCRYPYEPSAEQIETIAFGRSDPENLNYPLDSARGFYERASKGAMQLSGKAFRYTARQPVSFYPDIAGRQALLAEAMKALDAQYDFSEFDGDLDGYIDTVLLSVPTDAGNENWWPCAGAYGHDDFQIDGKMFGHFITGNAQIESSTQYYNFNSKLIHEMGHCMGLPDYYLYVDENKDNQGMHGTAGFELMEDNSTDLCCVSKLQLGWYGPEQILTYLPEDGEKTFTLYNAQTNSGNTVIIPYSKENSDYHGEYMMLEYATQTGNNSQPEWWVHTGSGVRVFHADTTLYDNGWGISYKYCSGSEFTEDNKGRRCIRIIDDRDTDNFYHPGQVIDGSISGFHWYDAQNRETVETGLEITVGKVSDDSCTVTIRPKG